MYILQTVHINSNECLFFEDIERELYWTKATSESKLHTANYYANLQLTLRDILKPKIYSSDVVQLDNGQWQKTIRTGYFPDISSAENYFTALLDESNELRRLRKIWHQEHNIIAKHHILDASELVLRTLGDCTLAKCHKFGSCTDNPNACNIYENLTKKIIPIQAF